MQEYERYLQVLKEQLIPATGCTEPIALAYAAAVCKKALGGMPEAVEAAVSGSIVKNVKSVVVPTTNGLKGIEAAIAAGITVGDPDAELQVLACAPQNTGERVLAFLEGCPVKVRLSDSGRLFDILITMPGFPALTLGCF